MIGKTYEDYDFPTRARQALKNQSSYPTPSDLLDSLKSDYTGTIETLFRIPHCGRNTVDDIIRIIGFEKPRGIEDRLAKFKDEDELLVYMEENDGIDATGADRPTLLMLLLLVSKDWATPRGDGHYEINKAGVDRVERLKADKVVKLTIKGRLGLIKRLIDSAQDDAVATQIDEHFQELEYNGKLTVELDG